MDSCTHLNFTKGRIPTGDFRFRFRHSLTSFDINLVSMVHLKNGADEVPRGDAPKQDDMQPVLLSTSCSRSITSKSVTPTVWSASWT